MPVVGWLMSKIEPRKLLGAGIVIVSFSFWRFAHLNLDVGYWDFFWPLIIQGVAMGLLFVPLTTVTNDPIPNEQMGNATSLFNLMRNIGASIGIATVTTMIARKSQVHTNDLAAHVTPYSIATQNTLQQMRAAMIAAGADPATALRQAYAAIWGMVERQATMMAYNDTFAFLMIAFLVLFPLIFLMRKPRHHGGGAMVH
jgi:DHA2 family multidrug resistance protein